MQKENTCNDDRLAAVERIWCENRCLKTSTIAVYQYWLRHFTAYCRTKQLKENGQLTEQGVAAFARWYARSRKIDERVVFEGARSAVAAWAHALRTLGESLSPWTVAADQPRSRSPLLREFGEHLRQHRGNPASTIRKKVAQVTLLKAFLHERGHRLQRLRLQDIDAYVVVCRKHYARTTVADICSTVRSFVRFLRATGRISTDFSSSIQAPVVRRYECPHRALPWDAVRRILCAVDRQSPCGQRDYALLLMMSTYGFGAGEVIGLTLDDIDWPAATLHVRRPKTGVEFVLPLMPVVAQALANYRRWCMNAN